jgi:hypothetical protein
MSRLRPLIGRSPPSAGSLRGQAPSLVTSPLPNATGFFEDFYNFTISTAQTDQLVYTIFAGTGLYGQNGGEGGVLTAATGPSAGNGAVGDGGVIEFGGGRTLANGSNLLLGSSAGQKTLMQWRVNLNSGTSNDMGFGLVVAATAIGTNWFLDPDTTLASTVALVFTRHSATYSGDTAGDLVMRVYGTGATSTSLTLGAMTTGASYQKIEALHDPTAALVYVYLNGAAVAGSPLDVSGIGTLNVSSSSVRPSMGIRLNGLTTQKFLSVDSLYVERSQASPR